MTATPYAVALVVDPDFGARLEALSLKVHTWIVATPTNVAAAEKIWNSLTKSSKYNMKSGVTTFYADLSKGREDWCEVILDSVDEHHNNYAHNPGYAILEVYGIPFTERLRPAFADLGFLFFENTDYGFCARKS